MDRRTRNLFQAELQRIEVYKKVLARAHYIVAQTKVDKILQLSPTGAAEELLQEAVLRTMKGERRWDPQTVPDLDIFLAGVMRSIASALFKKDATQRRHLAENTEQICDGSHSMSRASSNILEEKQKEERSKELEDALLSAAGDDDVLLLIVEALFDGLEKPRDIAADKGLRREQVYSGLRKLRKRLVSSRQKGSA